MSRFLRYAVERTLDGDREGLKESVIGTAVFDREPGYDPKSDPVVRNEARRLRAKLEEHYSRNQPPEVRISIPKGSYVAVFEFAGPPAEAAPAEPAASSPRRLHRLWQAAAMLAILVAAAGFRLLYPSAHSRRLPVLSTVTSYPGDQLYPCPSPDGSQVAFVWGGPKGGPTAIYIVGTNGGEPRRLTAGAASESFPAWSPNGSRIAFTRDGKIVVARVSGGEEHELTGAFPAILTWSPDGKSLVFSDWTSSETTVGLFAADPLTGARRRLTSPPDGYADSYPSFSPDGSRIAFARCGLSNCDVDTIAPGGGAPRRVVSEHTKLYGLTWSPDGRTLVYSSRLLGPYQLWQIPASGDTPPQPIPVAGEDARYPRFNTRPGTPARLFYEKHIVDSNIWRVPLVRGASGPRQFGGDASRVIASTRLDNSPRVSPDGRKVAFVSNRSGFDEIWTAAIDGSDAVALTNLRANGVGSPRWSPDSSRIVFDALGPAGRALFLVDAAGGTPRQWTAWGSAGRASWSRDGKWIFYHVHGPKGLFEVWKVSSTDPAQPQLVIRDGLDPFESPDGKTLFFVRRLQLWRMPADGPVSAAAQVPVGRPVAHGWWELDGGGVYFADLYSPPVYSAPPLIRGPKPIYYYDFHSRTLNRIGTITADVMSTLPDFAVSPGGAYLYYSAMEIAVSQVRMIEGAF